MFTLGLLAGLSIGQALAQTPPASQAPAPTTQQASAAAAPTACNGPRAWLAAEETTAGILQQMAREALAQCLAGVPTPAAEVRGAR